MTREEAKSELNNYGYTIGEQNCIVNRIYDDFEQELKKGQENYNMIWNMYSQLRRENQSLKKSNTYTYKKKENK